MQHFIEFVDHVLSVVVMLKELSFFGAVGAVVNLKISAYFTGIF